MLGKAILFHFCTKISGEEDVREELPGTALGVQERAGRHPECTLDVFLGRSSESLFGL
jgi:hypothetical protein